MNDTLVTENAIGGKSGYLLSEQVDHPRVKNFLLVVMVINYCCSVYMHNHFIKQEGTA